MKILTGADGWVTVTWEDAADDEVAVKLTPPPAEAASVNFQYVPDGATTVDVDQSVDGVTWLETFANDAGTAPDSLDVLTPYVRPSGLQDGDVFILTYPAQR